MKHAELVELLRDGARDDGLQRYLAEHKDRWWPGDLAGLLLDYLAGDEPPHDLGRKLWPIVVEDAGGKVSTEYQEWTWPAILVWLLEQFIEAENIRREEL